MARSASVIDRASGRLISAGPEEVDATQPLLAILIDERGWEPGQIVSRPRQWRVPSAPSAKRDWPVDIAIFEKAAHARSEDHVRILCECKRPDEKSGLRQLKIYLDREPHARAGVWFNGVDHVVVYKTVDGYDRAPPGTPIPGPDDALSLDALPERLSYDGLVKAVSLVPLFQRIRNRLVARDANVNRDEEILPDLSSLLLLKILDEQAHRFRRDAPLEFQCQPGSAKATATHVRRLLAREARQHPDVFGRAEARLAIDDASVRFAVELLQGYRLLENDAEVISTAFQVLRGRAYKGEEGQYFTPPSVVRLAVAAAAPDERDRVIDPACGSGSFLAEAFNAVSRRLASVAGQGSAEHAIGMRDWSTQKLYAVDKDSVSVRLSKAYLSLLGDGSTHVFRKDVLRKSLWDSPIREAVQDGSFSLVLTNPPFGQRLCLSPADGRTEGYEVCHSQAWDEASGTYEAEPAQWTERPLGVVFLERCLQLAEEGGRVAIVLPDTYLFSVRYQWFVHWICSSYTVTHSINVPIQAFEPYCRAKTSILVLKKARPRAGHRVVGMLTETYGETKKGRPLYKLDEHGNRTNILDDEMAEAARLLRSRRRSESRLRFTFEQDAARRAGVLTAVYHWRQPYEDALAAFTERHACTAVSVGELIADGVIVWSMGHGSPSPQFKGRGSVPYVKVSDIKNWRVNENPKYFIPAEEADRLRRGGRLEPFDVLMPTRACKNIGLGALLMPWQTEVVLTKEIAVLRCVRHRRLSPWLLLVLLSFPVVNDQLRFLVQMHTNREDLGRRLLELKLPLPAPGPVRQRWEKPARQYFEAVVAARDRYATLVRNLEGFQLVDRP